MVRLWFTLFALVSWTLGVSSSYGLTSEVGFGSGCKTTGIVEVSSEYATFETGGALSGDYQTSLTCTMDLTEQDLFSFRYLYENRGPDTVLNAVYPAYFTDSFQVEVDAGSSGYGAFLLAEDATGGYLEGSLDLGPYLSAMAARLTFSLLDEDDGQRSRAILQWSPMSQGTVPEPATVLLLGSGMIFLFTGASLWEHCRSGRAAFNDPRPGRWILTGMLLIGVTVPVLPGDVYSATPDRNVTEQVRVSYSTPIFNSRTSILSGRMVITNISAETLTGPLWVVVTGWSDPSIQLLNPSGYTLDGRPYLDLSELLANGMLPPGESTPSRDISFWNPNRLRFRWSQEVLVISDPAPLAAVQEVGPVIANICLTPGEFPSVCAYYLEDFDVPDPNFQRIVNDPQPAMFASVRVRIFVFDELYDVTGLEVTVNGQATSLDGEGAFLAEIALTDGKNELVIRSTNPDGITATRTLFLTVDTKAPSIVLLAPDTDRLILGSETIVNGRVDDSAINVLTLTHQGVPRSIPVIDGGFSAPLSLITGPNDLTLEVTDKAGNWTALEVTVFSIHTETGVLQGVVRSTSLGAPLSGVTLEVTAQGPPQGGGVYQASSGGNGTYIFTDLPSGNLSVLAIRNGYDPREVSLFLAGGDDPLIHEIALTPTTAPGTVVLTGFIRDRSGAPLTGVEVTLPSLLRSETTGPDGVYLFSALPHETLDVQIHKEGYEAIDRTVLSQDITTGIATQSFVLNKTPDFIMIQSPKVGEVLAGRDTLVLGTVQQDLLPYGGELTVDVNGVAAILSGGLFAANHVPLMVGLNTLTIEVRTSTGFSTIKTLEGIVSSGVDTVHLMSSSEEVSANARIGIWVDPMDRNSSNPLEPSPPPPSGRLQIEGPAPVDLLNDAGRYEAVLTVPGIYRFIFTPDPGDPAQADQIAIAVVRREDLRQRLQQSWTALLGALSSGDNVRVFGELTAEAAVRYQSDLAAMGESGVRFLSQFPDLQVVDMRDGMAQARLWFSLDGTTNYLWFIREADGVYRLHRL